MMEEKVTIEGESMEADLEALRSNGGADATWGGDYRVRESDEGRR